jgi:hypothetical protein
MKSLYARLVLWLISPALELRSQRRAATWPVPRHRPHVRAICEPLRPTTLSPDELHRVRAG